MSLCLDMASRAPRENRTLAGCIPNSCSTFELWRRSRQSFCGAVESRTRNFCLQGRIVACHTAPWREISESNTGLRFWRPPGRHDLSPSCAREGDRTLLVGSTIQSPHQMRTRASALPAGFEPATLALGKPCTSIVLREHECVGADLNCDHLGHNQAAYHWRTNT